jgi:hypothetical protein
LDKANRRKLLTAFPAKHEKVRADHLTLRMNPKNINDFPIGQKVDLEVLGEVSGKQAQAVRVRTSIPSDNTHPHITISHPADSSPKKSKELLAKASKQKTKPMTIKGRVGYVQDNRKKFSLAKGFTKI